MKRTKKLVGPLDGTKSEGITANMGISAYDKFIPIEKLLRQIRVNKQREKLKESQP